MRNHAFRLAPAALMLAVGVLTSVVVAGGAPASAAAGIVPPARDSFYRYSGTTPLARIPHGTALKERSVTLGLLTSSTPLPAEQILYRTTDAVGRPALSVTTVVLPVTGTVAPKVAAYLSFYDALTPLCDPSYTLRGGSAGSLNESTAEIEQALVESLRASGDIVTIPDFEDERLDYVAGTESGMSTLDGITATLSVLGITTAAPVGLMGYSGGSIAADWASELASSYAPQLHIVGTAMGGIPVDLAHNLRYVNGSPSWSDVMPAAMIGIARSFHIKLARYLSAYGKKIVAAESHECIGQFQGAYPNLTVARFVKKRYRHIFRVPILRRTLNKLIMGSAPGHPQEPMLMVAGNADGTGDGVMVERDEQQLAYEYCHQGVPVDFEQLMQLNHDAAGAAFFPQGIAYLQTRFAGLPPTDNCSTIKRGNSLAPLK
ncbi:MAG TPA: lipase family protein [Mycobacteriales bacterium]|nr:lipase family protein [Mycobacteriales bacterium]